MNSKQKSTLRDFFKLGKRVSNKYMTNVYNVLGQSYQSKQAFWNDLLEYHKLITKPPPPVIYHRLPDMNITTFQKPVVITEDFENLGEQISEQIKNNVFQAWQRELTIDNQMNHLRVFFRVQFENGQWRTIKSTEYYHISQLIQLGDNLQEALQGVQNMEEYDFGNIVNIEAVLSFSHLTGGCDIMPHISVFTLDNIGNLRIRSVKSSNNNCGIDAILHRMKNLDKPQKQRSKTIRKHLFNHQNELSIDEIKQVALYLQVDIEIYSPKGLIVNNTGLFKENGIYIALFINNHHYYLVEDILPIGHLHKSYCLKCNKLLKTNHKCPIDKFNQQNSLIHRINKNKYTMTNPTTHELYNILFKENKNIILHSEGGVGKSYLIVDLISMIDTNNQLVKDTNNIHNSKENGKMNSKENGLINYIIVCPTGIASQNIGGITIHSLFGIPIDKPFQLDKVVEYCLKHQIQYIDLLIIDEISMVSDTLLEQIHLILSTIHQNNLPFGGIRVLFSGDFLQLPPITHRYCFESKVFKELDLLWVELTNKYRFIDEEYSKMVSQIRFGKLSHKHQLLLQQCLDKPLPNNIKPTQLLPKLKDIDRINQQQYDLLDSPSIEYPVAIKKYYPRSPSYQTQLENETRPENQYYKIGCQVMFTHNLNDTIKNGTRGIITQMCNQKITIQLLNGKIYKCSRKPIKYHTKYGYTIIHQFPLQYAWAISIHKCQGLTLDCAIIDLGKDIFDYHMVYVALSRIRSFESLYLKNFQKSSIRVSGKVLKYLANPNNYQIIDDNHFRHNLDYPLKYQQDQEFIYNMVDMKTIFFDMETFTNQDNNLIEPYYNYLSVWNMGKLVETKEFMLGDNSQNVSLDTFNYIMSLVSRDCIQKSTSSKLHNFFYKQPYTICAYNGSGFDFHFLLNQFLYSNYSNTHQLKHIVKDNKLMSIRLLDHITDRIVLRTHDIFNIIGGSLNQAVKDFTSLGESKDIFPHLIVNKKPNIWLEDNIEIDLDDFYPQDIENVKTLIIQHQLDINNYPIKDKLKLYCKKDVELLIMVYRGLDTYLKEILNIDLFDYLTANMISNYGFMTNLPNTMIKQQTKDKMITRLPRYTDKQELYIRDAIIGGKAFPRIKYFKSKNEKNDYYIYFDISGMYVSIMKNNPFPIDCPHWGNPVELQQILKLCQLPPTTKLENGYYWNPEWDKIPFCIVDCLVQLHPLEVEPPVGYKHKSNIIWDLKERQQKYSNIALLLILKNGGKIKSIDSGLIWDSNNTEYIFQQWMNKTLHLKKQGEETGNNSLRVLGKLLGNSTYGSMLKHDSHMKIELIHNHQEKEQFLIEHSFNYLQQVKDDLYYIGGDKLDKSDYLSKSPIHLGVFILDYSKQLLDEIIQTINPERREGTIQSIKYQPLTGDTDSLVVHSSLLPRLYKWIKNENGYLVDELNKHFHLDKKKQKPITNILKMNFAKIVEAYAPIPKAYAYRFKCPHKLDYCIDSKGYYNLVKIKGIPKNNITIQALNQKDQLKIYQHLDFQLINDIFTGELKKDSIEVISKNRIKKIGNKLSKIQLQENIQMFRLQTQQLKRHLFRTEYLGRQTILENYTIPIGYDSKQLTFI